VQVKHLQAWLSSRILQASSTVQVWVTGKQQSAALYRDCTDRDFTVIVTVLTCRTAPPSVCSAMPFVRFVDAH